MADRMVNISHKDGREFAILPADFTKVNIHPKDVGSYADQGFVIERYEDGSEYAGPKSKREIQKQQEERAAAREAKAPAPAAKAEPKGKAGD